MYARVITAGLAGLALSLGLLGVAAGPSPGLPSAAVRLRMETTATAVPVGVQAALNALPVNAQGKYVGGAIGLTAWSVSPTYGSTLTAKEGAGTEFSAKAPGVYQVRAVLGRLHSALTIRVVAAHLMASIGVTPLVLSAPSSKDKQLMALVGADTVPKGMPTESRVIDLSVPLYAGAKPTSATVENYPAPIPVSWYLLASPVEAYQVKASQSTVDLWYLEAMTQMGYTLNGQGGGANHIITYDFTKNPKAPDPLTIGIRTRVDHGGTAVVYGATALSVPARPRSSLLPGTVQSLDLTYQASDSTKKSQLEVTQASVVQQIVNDLNAMPLASAGTNFGCGPDDSAAPSVSVKVVSPAGSYPAVSLSWSGCVASTIGGVQVSTGSSALMTVVEGLYKTASN